MPLRDDLFAGLTLPVIASPMFLASTPDLVVETCRAGLIGSMPALNARTTEAFGATLNEIEARLGETKNAAPFAINLIVHRTNVRLADDLAVVVAHKVPIVITSLGADTAVVEAVHSYGGLVFHDVISRRHAQKAAAAGVDGIIAVCAGAGGHAGTLSPFALVSEIREVFGGMIVAGGSISTGAQVAAARVMGADLAYIGTRFMATAEAGIDAAYKAMLVDSRAQDILYTPAISGVNANFLRPSIEAAGLDPDGLGPPAKLDSANEGKAWKNIWSAGHGVGAIHDVVPVRTLCERLHQEYRAACRAAAADRFAA